MSFENRHRIAQRSTISTVHINSTHFYHTTLAHASNKHAICCRPVPVCLS